MKVERAPKTTDAPVVPATEASRKFLEAIFKDSTMETTATPAKSQLSLVNQSIDAANLAYEYGTGIEAILTATARLTTEDLIKDLAIHAKNQAQIMNNDLSVFQMNVEEIALNQRGVN